METAGKKGATYKDIEDAPEHLTAELIDGELFLSPRPLVGATAQLALGADLYMAFGRGRGGPGGWLIVAEAEVHVGENVVVPDLAGWRRERLPNLADSYPTIAPDWICEVLSPSTTRLDRNVKMPLYAREGVRWLWFVQPRARFLEAHRLREGVWEPVGVFRGDETARIEPFDAIELDLSFLWADGPLPSRASEESAEYAP